MGREKLLRDETFGAWIRRRRQDHDLSLRDVGTRADVDYTYLSRIEAGKVPPPADDVVRRLAVVLGDIDGEGATLAAQERRLPIRTIRAVLRSYPELANLIERLARDTDAG